MDNLDKFEEILTKIVIGIFVVVCAIIAATAIMIVGIELAKMI